LPSICSTNFGRNGLTPAELAFVAESATIFIQPRQGMASLQLLDVPFPKFRLPWTNIASV
jgi:hypothetical protein